ncbi:MAG: NUDIX hydrolase [Oscillospiraceae bacterium]|nr:NUDIX hydrolase [Oscillospiraceae bacterium]
MDNNSEQAFLAGYSMDDYERPSVTADVAAFMIRSEACGSYRKEPQSRLSVLLIRRGGHPYKDCWALPGGFLQKGETIEECALREITEEAGVAPAALMLTGLYTAPDRDPRGWIISAAFASVITDTETEPVGGDDANDAQWFDVSFDNDDTGSAVLTLMHGNIRLEAHLTEHRSSFGRTEYRIAESGGIAFDHAAMIASALSVLRSGAENFSIIFDFLPEKFTLNQLQRVQETIMNISVLPPNFRRKAADYVTETDEYTSGAGHRPAKLFMKK